jgi:hypothetical protein
MQHYLANSPDTQVLYQGSQAERRKRFDALQLTIPGLITAAELHRKMASHPRGTEGNRNCQHSSKPVLTHHGPA